GKISALLSESRALRVTAVVILSIGAVFAVLAAVISVFMVNAAHSYPSGSSTVIVLGCKVRGETPSLMLGQRINAAYRYLEANPDAVCIASGGQGADELISEAECIKRVLVEKGIAEERIILEDKSTSTDENIRFSAEKMNEYGISGSITIVTSEYHQLRAKMIADKYGLESYAISSNTAFYLLPTYWLREWFGVVYQFLFGSV
ncbi:MAG: YdcF family protein, partial [Oscillospiraceae bacterium]|nr:YdcF family protein [Oscillospiraceae bacterium]